MPLCQGAPWQNVFLLQLSLAGSVPQFDVQGISSANLNGQSAWNRDAIGTTCHRDLRALKHSALKSAADSKEVSTTATIT